MTEQDPFEFPEIRVQKPDPNAPARTPRATVAKQPAPSHGDLAAQWLEAWAAKRDAEAKMTKLRKQIEALLDSGETVGNEVGSVSWQTSTSLKADAQGLLLAAGPEILAQVSEVSATKLRELIDSGRLDKDAPFIRYETVKRLVTKLR